jgi:hypothetical protein
MYLHLSLSFPFRIFWWVVLHNDGLMGIVRSK